MASFAEGPVSQSDSADVFEVEDGGTVGRSNIVVRDHLEEPSRGQPPRPRRVQQIESLQPGRILERWRAGIGRRSPVAAGAYASPTATTITARRRSATTALSTVYERPRRAKPPRGSEAFPATSWDTSVRASTKSRNPGVATISEARVWAEATAISSASRGMSLSGRIPESDAWTLRTSRGKWREGALITPTIGTGGHLSVEARASLVGFKGSTTMQPPAERDSAGPGIVIPQMATISIASAAELPLEACLMPVRRSAE